jgi:hypothetical protein
LGDAIVGPNNHCSAKQTDEFPPLHGLTLPGSRITE